MSTSLAGFALTINPTTRVIAAYASGARTLQAYPLTRWIVLGSFRVPEAVRARLNVLGFSTTGVEAQVALFGPRKIEDSEVTLSSGGLELLSLSSVFDLEAGKLYQVAAHATYDGDEPNRFAVIRTVSLGDV